MVSKYFWYSIFDGRSLIRYGRKMMPMKVVWIWGVAWLGWNRVLVDKDGR